ncbi:MAG TPA: amino acid ABC transporter permease [Anaerolineae bacterium]|nr:amino acid ABC transporter permease [Anaerolineae bacterium]
MATTDLTAPETAISRPPAPLKPMEWIRKNLFHGWFNSILTIVTLVVLFVVLRGIFNWVFFSANWTPVVSSLRLFAVGQYPTAQLWRVGLILATLSLLMGLSWGVWGGTVRTFALALAVGFAVIALLPLDLYRANEDPLDLSVRVGFASYPVLILAGYALGKRGLVKSRLVAVLWLVSLVLTFVLLSGFSGSELLPRVETGLWGGLLLTFLLAFVGIVASFPIGVLLALGRQSSLPVLKIFCTMFIELVRGVPLVTILFMFSLILPLFLPPDVRLDRVLRAMAAMTFFAAAYMAENVRGGLQSIPRGQVEAAKAVGLSGLQITTFIVLPQALRAVIPAIVGQFIALFMDTTLAIIVGLVELLAVGRAVLNANVEWLLLDKEVYIFIAAIFWIFTFSMSYASRRLERALGVGER